MSEIPALLRRVVAGAGVLDVPDGMAAMPTGRGDVEDITGLRRAYDIAGCGHTSANLEETQAWLAHPSTDWEYGAVTMRRDSAVVGVLVIRDGLKSGLGWSIEVVARPGDVLRHAISGALIDAALREGRYRWDALYMDPDDPLPVARAACYANDTAVRADLSHRGFVLTGSIRRLKVDHWSVQGLALDAAPDTGESEPGAQLPSTYGVRAFADTATDWQGVHAVATESARVAGPAAVPEFDVWQSHHRAETQDPSQWVVAESEGRIVGLAMGSNRYASEDYGYVADLAVVPDHREQGVGRALLRARLDDDIERGFLSTIAYVDPADTAAWHLAESLGLVPDSEFVVMERPLFRSA